MYLDSSKESLVLAIEIFNRPMDTSRKEGTLLLLNHSLEMLLKAILFEKTGKIKAKRDKFNYGFEKCINICLANDIIELDDALLLKNVNAFRDEAAHDILGISEGVLYVHVLSALSIYEKLLRRLSKENLSSFLPNRVLPVTANPPRDITILIKEEMTEIASLLAKGKRQQDQAENKLKTLLIMENNIRELYDERSLSSSKSVIRKVKKKVPLEVILKYSSNLVLAQGGTSGTPVSLHITKNEGIPVRIDKDAPHALVLKYVSTEERYPFLTKELAKKLKISVNKLVWFVKLFDIEQDESFRTQIRMSGELKLKRYSSRAYELFRNAIEREGVDILVEKYRNGEKLNPAVYLV